MFADQRQLPLEFAQPTSTMMSALSLYQPYASLSTWGDKSWETRGHYTRFRGPLLVHATREIPDWCYDQFKVPDFLNAITAHQHTPHTLVCGAIIGMVTLRRCISTEQWKKEKRADKDNEARWVREMMFGDYRAGRWAWELVNPVEFREPIPARGYQNFWNYDMEPYLDLIPQNYGH